MKKDIEKKQRLALALEFFRYLLNNPAKLDKFGDENYVSVVGEKTLLVKSKIKKRKTEKIIQAKTVFDIAA